MHGGKRTLIVFGGLPGTGKTTLARAAAEAHAAVGCVIAVIASRLFGGAAIQGHDEPTRAALDRRASLAIVS